MSEETSGSSDWALVTQEGEIEDESEDDGSYSNSSIELLTSDEDTDVGVPEDSERRGGPFFVLRLRSKEFLAESDSDEKEGPVETLSKDEISHVSTDKGGPVESLSKDEVSHLSSNIGDNSEPEHTGERSYPDNPELLRPNSSDSGERSEPELLQPDSSDSGERSEPELQPNSSDSGERSEPELLQPDSSDNVDRSELELQPYLSDIGDRSDPELIQPATGDNTEIHHQLSKSNQNEHPEQGTSLDMNSSNLKETGTDPKFMNEEMKEITVTSLSSEISAGTSYVSDTVTEVMDNTPVTRSQGNSGSSVESIPEVLLPEVLAEIKIEDQGISMATGEVSSANSKNESSHEPADDFDMKDVSSIGTSSQGSSSFSLLNDDVDESKKNNLEDFEGNMIDLGHNEDEGNFSFIEHAYGIDSDSTSGDMTVIPEQEQQKNDTKEHGEDTITDEPVTRDVPLDQSNQVVYRRQANFILLLLEVFWVIIIGLASFAFGYYQGTADQIVKINQEIDFNQIDFNQQNTGLSRALQETRDELDAFYTHFNEIRKLKNNFERKVLDPEHVDWINLFGQKDYSYKNERFRNLDMELNRMEKYMAYLLTTNFEKIKRDKQILQEKHSVEIANLKRQMNNLKNEKSDVEKDIIELGKKKYLVRELEDENLALIKSIGDMESQMMEAEDQRYVLQLQISKLQKKRDMKVNNEDDVTVLKQKTEGLENQRKYLTDQVILHKDTIEQLKGEKKSAEIVEAERWKVENVELKTKWGALSIKVQSLENELSKAYKRISDLENELSDVKRDAAIKPDNAYDILRSQDEHQVKETMKREDKVILDAGNIELHNKHADIKDKYERLLKKERVDMSHDDIETYNSEEDQESTTDETEQGTSQTLENSNTYNPKPDRPTLGKASPEGWKGEREKQEEDTSRNDELHKSWSDAMNEILNKTKSSMVNVSQQIQDTLSQVKNLSEELWKKHEPTVNQILSKTYENVKKNVNKVTEKVTKVTSKILEKSAKWIKKYKKAKKNRRRGKKYNNGDSDQATYTASTSRRQYSSGKHQGNHDFKQHPHDQKFSSDQNHDNHDYNQQPHYQNYNQDYKHDNSDFQKFNHDQPYISPGFLENELQSLNDSVEYINTLHRLNCNDMIDIMEDFQEFKKLDGLNILSDREKSWFFCQKSWFESMVYSDPSIDDSECLEKLGQRQLAATDHRCCPCLGQYGNYVGKFCSNDGCSHQKPIEKKSGKQGKQYKKIKEGPQISDQDELEKNKTAEEDMFKNQGNFVYCDPFSHDLDCGDESWYLKRMKERDHLRKYRTSSKTDWLFKRADDRDYERTKPDDWYFNRMGGGQAYEAYQDDTWYDENWYIRKIHDDKKNPHDDDDIS